MYCQNCGKQVNDDFSFCPYCGCNIFSNNTQSQQLGKTAPVGSTAGSPGLARLQEYRAQYNNPPIAVRVVNPPAKRSIFSRWWFWLIIIIFFLSCCTGSDESEQVKKSSLSEADYKASCSTIAFDDLARNPDKYAGKLYTFTGEVVQVQRSGSHWILRIDVTPVTSSYGDDVLYYEDTIYAVYYPTEGEDNILEDDIVTIYGRCAGEETYTSILGTSISLPRIDVEYYELVAE